MGETGRPEAWGPWMRGNRIVILFASVLSLHACREVPEDRDRTGVDVTLIQDPSLKLDQVSISGTLDGEPLLEPSLVPEEPEPLNNHDNSVVILLPDEAAGRTILLRVDGLSKGAIKASGQEPVFVPDGRLVDLDMTLGAPAICGDGLIRSGIERCDDRNIRPGDGCGSDCLVEQGWRCEGEPSLCHTCGDGTCDPGEDICSCPADCIWAVCGDGFCCASGHENTCTCHADCGSACGDGCCNGDERAATCPEDCA